MKDIETIFVDSDVSDQFVRAMRNYVFYNGHPDLAEADFHWESFEIDIDPESKRIVIQFT